MARYISKYVFWSAWGLLTILSNDIIGSKMNILFGKQLCKSTSYRGCSKKLYSRRYSGDVKANTKIISFEEVQRFIVDCLVKLNAPEANARILADVLIDADHRGFHSHGLNRLIYYTSDIKGGACDPTSTPTILKESTSSALVDGRNNLGPVIATFCMDLAIQKAKDSGIALVAAKRCNHFGIGSTYVTQAVKKHFIGMCFTNTSPVMVPTRAKQSALGSNPISVGAPATESDNMVLDFATTVVSFGKIDLFLKRGLTIPVGWGLNKDGKDEIDPRKVLQSGRLLPLGGNEMTSGYKGFAFGLMVEMLTGVLAGANVSPHVRFWTAVSNDKPKQEANLGQSFIAINPKLFSDSFEESLKELLQYLRNLEPVDPRRPVAIPGDMERQHMKNTDKQGGVIYLQTQINIANELAKELKVAPLKFNK